MSKVISKTCLGLYKVIHQIYKAVDRKMHFGISVHVYT